MLLLLCQGNTQVVQAPGVLGPERERLAIGLFRKGGLSQHHKGHPQVVEVFGSEPGPLTGIPICLNRILVLALNQADLSQQPPGSEIIGVVTKDLPAEALGLGMLAVAMALPREGHAFVGHGIRSRWIEESRSLAAKWPETGQGENPREVAVTGHLLSCKQARSCSWGSFFQNRRDRSMASEQGER